MLEKEGLKGWNYAKEVILSQETRSPQLREVMNYITEQPDFFRPAVTSLCSQAVGGSSEITVPTSASLILLGKAIGVHDDVIDDLKVRNQRRTAFGKFGKEMALILSDVLLFKAFTLLRRNIEMGIPYRAANNILDTIDHIWFEQAEGEVLEIQSRRQTDLTPEKCLAKIRMRASEMEAIARIGGVLGGGSKKEIEASGEYGRCVGTASLLRDELIDLLELDTFRHRIENESLPLPLIYALQNDKMRSKVGPIISKPELAREDLRAILLASDEAGGLTYTANLITQMIQEATIKLGMLKTGSKELKILAVSLEIDPEEWNSLMRSMSTSSNSLLRES